MGQIASGLKPSGSEPGADLSDNQGLSAIMCAHRNRVEDGWEPRTEPFMEERKVGVAKYESVDREYFERRRLRK